MESGSLHAEEYDFAEPNLNLARVTLKGRYPEKGRTMNTLSTECCLVLSGSGTLIVEDSVFELEEGDACIIEPGERYYWDADITLAITSTPAWTADQTKQVP